MRKLISCGIALRRGRGIPRVTGIIDHIAAKPSDYVDSSSGGIGKLSGLRDR